MYLSPMDPSDPVEPPGDDPPPATYPALPTERAPAGMGLRIDRQTVTLSHVISAASDAWRRDIGIWILATVICVLIGFGLSLLLQAFVHLFGALLGGGEEPTGAVKALLGGIDFGIQILEILVQGALIMGYWAMALQAMNGKPAAVGALFSQIHKVWKYLLQWVVILIPVILFGAIVGAIVYGAFVGPIDFDMPLEEAVRRVGPAVAVSIAVALPFCVYYALGVFFASTELVFNDRAGAIEAIAYSWRIVRGRRWLTLGVILIAGLILAGSVLLCGVGVLFGAPFAVLMATALYLALRHGAEVPEPVTTSTLGQATAVGGGGNRSAD